MSGAQVGSIFNNSNTFYGLQIALLMNKTVTANAIQLGIVNVFNKYNGFQAGLVNIGEDFSGVQYGFLNISEDSEGLQLGLYFNSSRNTNVAQCGFINTTTEKVTGVQIGAINICKTLEGVQLGLLNIVGKAKITPVMIGLNIGW
jgi:hypothetical protein